MPIQKARRNQVKQRAKSKSIHETRAKIWFIGPFPPPVHGFAVITEALAAEVAKYKPIDRISITGESSEKFIAEAQRLCACLVVCWRLLTVDKRHIESASVGANAGWGQAYNLLILAVTQWRKIPATFHHHSYAYIDQPSKLMRLISKRLSKHVTHVFLSDAMRQSFKAVYGEVSRDAILPNAIFVPNLDGNERVPGEIVIGLLSNLSREKGLADFVDTAYRLKNEGLPVRAILAGPAPLKADMDLIKEAEAKKVLEYRGPLYGLEKYKYFEEIDIFMFPTRYRHEAQPTVIYEALSAGVPVISYDRGTIRDQVADTLLVIDSGESFARAATEACRELAHFDSAQWDKLRQAAKQRYLTARAAGLATLSKLFALDATDSGANQQEH